MGSNTAGYRATTTPRPLTQRRRRLLALWLAGAIAATCLGTTACDRTPAGSPEAVADAFCDAYFRLADQEKAKQFTAFGATKMLDDEIRDVKALRDTGYTPSAASIDVAIERGARSERGHRVRFDYAIKFRDANGEAVTKHADIELSKVHDEWKVVRIGLSKRDLQPAATAK